MGPVAIDIRVRRATKCLEVSFDDGHVATLAAEYLRVESPSAAVQGHTPDQKILVSGKQDVNITQAEPIGNYAVRLRFSDGHDTGIFTWPYLHQLSAEYADRWPAYLSALSQRGLSRLP